MRAAEASRGQPLLVLAGLLAAWLGLRVAVWQPVFDTAVLAAPVGAEAGSDFGDGPAVGTNERFALFVEPRLDAIVPHRAGSFPARPTRMAGWVAPPIRAAAISAAGRTATGLEAVRVAVGHTLLLAAGLSQIELPTLLAAYLQGAAPSQPGVPAAAPAPGVLPQHAPSPTGSRWSADAWLMAREDTTSAVVSGRPSYGRSQAGAVVRYRLAPTDPHGLQAYLRASSALAGALEKDLVAGLSGRPVPALPLRFAAEARISETDAGTELRPAVMAVTEFPPVSLPLGTRGEAYVQGGYVGGRSATAFVDGQARVERPVVRSGEAEVTAGVGVWGGAQKGAARLDIGPTAGVSFRLGPRSFGARGRVAADYRIRVAGDAEPASGPALTLSAGF